MKKLCIASAFCLILTFSGCSSNSNSQTKPQDTTRPVTTESKSTVPTDQGLTLTDLKKYNGQNGNPAYVVVNGTIYDVTNAKEWKKGKHKSGITAGQDLTKEIASSPHGKDVLKDLSVIGKLK